MPSYHDLHITTAHRARASIFNLPFRVRVICTRVAGWEVWAMAERREFEGGVSLQEELLGGEFEGHDKGLILDVAGHVICDSLTPLAERVVSMPHGGRTDP
jgi:hypothetical protein